MDNWTQLLDQAPLPWHKFQWQRLVKQRQESHLAHAYLLTGANGLGKLLFAYRFAQYLLCLSPQDDKPCGQCRNCQAGGRDFHPDVLLVETAEDKKVIAINQIRELSQFVHHTTLAGGAKVVIVRAADRMNTSAANALLKTLEEPAANTCLMLVSSLPGYLSATIRSRCQRLLFATPSLELGSAWLQQQLQEGDDAASLLLAAAGKPLEALELARNEGLEGRNEFSLKLAEVVRGQSAPETLVNLALGAGEMRAVQYFCQTSSILLSVLMGGQQETDKDAQIAPILERLREAKDPLQTQRYLMRLYQDAMEARRQLLSGANPNPRLLLESLCWRWSNLLRSR